MGYNSVLDITGLSSFV